MHLKNGHQLQNGKYRIESKIGQGGFGITYRAFWTMTVQGAMGAIETEIPVVIKEFFWKNYCAREEGTSYVNISSATGKGMFARFKEKLKKEAKILSRLTHPNIVSVLDIFEENNTAYMILQLVEGESLKDKIARLGKLDETTALKYMRQLCSALIEVHGKRILHLDIKPGNVIIDKNDNAQLLDFGISKQYDDNQKETSTTPLGISKGYTPLEQYSSIETFSPPTDVYALGATFYTMLTGQIPLEATQRIITDLEPIRKFNPDVSDRTVAVVEKAMEIKPAKRFQSVRKFREALNNNAFPNATVKKTIISIPKKNKTDDTKIEKQPEIIKIRKQPAKPLIIDTESKILFNHRKKNRIGTGIGIGVAIVAVLAVVFYLYTNPENRVPVMNDVPTNHDLPPTIVVEKTETVKEAETNEELPKTLSAEQPSVVKPDPKKAENDRKKREEQAKQEKAKQEKAKQEQAKLEQIRQEQIRQEQAKQAIANLLRQADNTFNDKSLGSARYEQSYLLYLKVKNQGGDVSSGYYNFLSLSKSLINAGSGFDKNVKKMLQYAQRLNNTQEVRDLLEKCN